MQEQEVTLTQAAQLLGRSKGAVSFYVRTGALPARRAGRCTFIPLSAVEARRLSPPPARRPARVPSRDAGPLLDPGDVFWSKVEKAGLLGCWIWTAAQGRGYGNIRIAGKLHLAHRLAYRAAGNTIPAGMQLDHLCRNRACVNPAHLEVVTPRENTRRGAAVVTACRHGHPFDERNTRITPQGHRRCRTCHRLSVRERARRAA